MLTFRYLLLYFFFISLNLSAAESPNSHSSYLQKALSWCQNRLEWLEGEGKKAPIKNLVYVSGNIPKQQEIQRLLLSEGENIALTFVSYKDLPTLESIDVDEITRFRAKEAFKRYNAGRPEDDWVPILIDELSVVIKDKDTKGFYPGVNFKGIIRGMGADNFAKVNAGKPVEIDVAAGYTVDGENVEIFHGSIQGTITYPLRWGEARPQIDADGYDPFVIPNGYNKTVAEMFDEREFISPRRLQFLQLRSHIFGKIYKGVYEIHVTVKTPERQSNETEEEFSARSQEYEKKFRETCEEMKHGVIAVRNMTRKVTADGKIVEQYFFQLQTKKYVSFDTGAEAIDYTLQLGRTLREKGFPPIRHRAEAMFFNSDAPETDEEALQCNPENYFELHLKVKNADGKPLNAEQKEQIIALAHKHKKLVSMVGDHFFVNQKYYNRGRKFVKWDWEKFVDQVLARGFTIKKIPWEYCIFDDKKSIDKNWVH